MAGCFHILLERYNSSTEYPWFLARVPCAQRPLTRHWSRQVCRMRATSQHIAMPKRQGDAESRHHGMQLQVFADNPGSMRPRPLVWTRHPQSTRWRESGAQLRNFGARRFADLLGRIDRDRSQPLVGAGSELLTPGRNLGWRSARLRLADPESPPNMACAKCRDNAFRRHRFYVGNPSARRSRVQFATCNAWTSTSCCS